MKCPRCGREMHVDEHRRYALNMCYECGYIEGRMTNANRAGATNFEHLLTLNLTESAAFISGGLNLDEEAVADWLDNIFEE